MRRISHHRRRPDAEEKLANVLTIKYEESNNPGMTKDQAVKHFGTQVLLAKALGLSQGSISLWGEHPPALRQLQIEAMTGGALKAEPDCDKYRVPQAA